MQPEVFLLILFTAFLMLPPPPPNQMVAQAIAYVVYGAPTLSTGTTHGFDRWLARDRKQTDQFLLIHLTQIVIKRQIKNDYPPSPI